MRISILGLALAGLIAASPAVAAGPPADDASVLKWAFSHVQADDWHVLKVAPYGVLLAPPEGVTLRADGLAELDVRSEFIEPLQIGGGPVRSTLEHLWVDCRASRSAMMKVTLYPENNLKGSPRSRSSDQPRWEAAGGADDEATIASACDAIQVGKKLD